MEMLHKALFLFLACICVLTPRTWAQVNSNFGFVTPAMHAYHPNVSRYLSQNNHTIDWTAISGAMIQRLRGFFYVWFSVGDPPQYTYALFDTGSIFTWLQSTECQICYDQGSAPRYDFRKSKTWRDVGCSNKCDSKAFGGDADLLCIEENNQCQYDALYEDVTKSTGYLGTETFSFMTDPETKHILSVPGVFLGRGIYNSVPSEPGFPGILGMTEGPSRFLDALHVIRFSYCIPSGPTDVGFVRFGTQAIVSGHQILYEADRAGIYHFKLRSLLVNERAIKVSPRAFEEGIVVDTGTPVTKLHKDAYFPFLSRVKLLIKTAPLTVLGWYPCYPSIEAVKNLRIAYEFQGYTYQLNSNHMWLKVKDSYCLTVTNGGFLNILGAYHMTDVNFGFDLYLKKIFINGDVECEKLI